MSVLNQINSVKTDGGSKKTWTAHDVSMYFGMKILGYSRKAIAEEVGHSVHSCSYLSRKYSPKIEGADQKLQALTGFTTVNEYKQYAEECLADQAMVDAERLRV